MPRKPTSTKQQLREAEKLLQRMRDLGLKTTPKRKSRNKNRLTVVIDGNDVTIVRSNKRNNSIKIPNDDDEYDYDYDDYSYDYGYDYEAYNYDYSYGYEAYSYEYGYDYEAYSYTYDYNYDSYSYAYNYGYETDKPPRKHRNGSETLLTVTIQIKADGQVHVTRELPNRRRRRSRKKSQSKR